MKKEWHLYIIECKTGDLYVGIAEDVEERVRKHNSGEACRYTRFRKPVKLLGKELCGNYSQARKREKQVKRFSRKKKLALIDKQKKDLSPASCFRKKAAGSRSILQMIKD